VDVLAMLRMKSSLFISIAREVTQSKYQMPSRSACEKVNGLHIGTLVLLQSEISPAGNNEKQLHRTPVYYVVSQWHQRKEETMEKQLKQHGSELRKGDEKNGS
jgi:hypothetical protein